MFLIYEVFAVALIALVDDGSSRSLNKDFLRSSLNGEEEMIIFNDKMKENNDSTVKTSSSEDSNLVFLRQIENPKILQDIFLSCAERNNSLPYLTSPYDFECYEVGAKGPCGAEDKWIVLSDSEDPFPWSTCKKNPCHEYPGRVPFFGDCAHPGTVGFCNSGMEIQLDLKGEGVCECRSDYIPIVDERNFTYCYQEYLRGPCEEGQHLIRNEEDGEGNCVPTNCESKDQIRWNNGKCFDSVPCEEGGSVTFENGILSCETSLRQLITIPEICKDGEAKDASGECREVFSNSGRSTRSSVSSKLALKNNNLSKFMCVKYPNKFRC